MGGHRVLSPRGLLLVRGAGRPHGPIVCHGPDVQLVLVKVRSRAAGLQPADRSKNRPLRGPSEALLPLTCAAAGLPLQALCLSVTIKNETGDINHRQTHRHITAICEGFRVWWWKKEGSEYAVYLTHDLSMLRLIETFCESAPQLTLMIYVMLSTNKAREVQLVSIAASTTSIAWMVVDYHRSLRSFLPDKAKQSWGSSLIYFLWNLLLIAPRLAALALFASVLSAYIAAHFLILWFVFVLWAWQQRTDFMDSDGGEWLYRVTVGLIWYFSWFNVAEGRTRGRSLIYHSFITTDGVILLATWWCYRDPVQTEPYALALIISLPLTYLLGLLFKALYYCCFHPKLWRPVVKDSTLANDLPDGTVSFRNISIQNDTLLVNKRMTSHVTCFYLNRRGNKNTDGTVESSDL
ncbi:XK-related protein 8.3 isoform X2 [Mastacembelus armatus]|uniref:XK-related protein n=1 Tax=Mastacembelus armatus TaxID=205130 RepID=A0A3Q3RQI8_9TELE|nr:XK-related protein 8-like isoform X2 [Mastacembelus armatus]